MPALKRKRPEDDDDTGTSVKPIVVDESEEEEPGVVSKRSQGATKRNSNEIQSNEATCRLQQDTPQGPPIKKQKVDESASIEFNFSGALFRSSEVSELDEVGYPQAAWGRDRPLLSAFLLQAANTFRTDTVDSSLLDVLRNMERMATSLQADPGRSPAYKRAQNTMAQNQSLLMQLPLEIRRMIWKAANPPKLDCCFAGLRWHDQDRAATAMGIKNFNVAYIHLTKGRGLPISRCILTESQAVAEPVEALLCSLSCMLKMEYWLQAILLRPGPEPQRKKWMFLRRLKVPKGECSAKLCTEFCDSGRDVPQKLSADWNWQWRFEGDFIVFENPSGNR
jgi:hypothetical protein